MRYLLAFLLLPTLALAQGTSPTDYVQNNVDAVVAILTDPAFPGEAISDTQMEQLSTMVDTFFDAQELSKRALGQYWRTFDAHQRQEFQQLFLQLIKSVYLKKSISYNNEQVIFDQEIIKSDTLAEVHTTLISPSLNVPVFYYLINRSGGWKVYDVAIENVSLIKNYRSQFQSILQTKSPEQLMTILKDKINEQG